MSQHEDGTWVDSTTWLERWDRLKRLPGGGQGEAFQGRRKADGKIAFIKAIKAKTDPERRARFFREASAYDTFKIPGVPSLIESNAHRHKDASFESYIATVFIEGPTLRAWREENPSVTLETATSITRSLLEVLRDCHNAGCVHRDVKPDNIILFDHNSNKIFLLDFGLNYHEIDGLTFRTEDWQEIGNRFLRLPELSAGSHIKQDLRSDLTFAAGILFYIITGKHPDILQDAEGKLPHQRNLMIDEMRRIAEGRFWQLAALFDRAFVPQISERYASVETMLQDLSKMIDSVPKAGENPDEDLAAILEIVNADSERRRLESVNRISRGLNQVQRVYSGIVRGMAGGFVLGQTNLNHGERIGSNTLFLQRSGSRETILETTYVVQEIGDEIVVTIQGEIVYRTFINEQKYDENFQSTVRAWLLRNIRSALEG